MSAPLVVICRGIPGSGKSTYLKEHYPKACVCSADAFFIQDDGEYRFNSTKLSEAHGKCLRDFIYFAQKDWEDLVIAVDNTNTTATEIAPYYAIAQAYDATIHLVNFTCDPKVAAERNVHGVPLEACKRMHNRLTQSQLPSRWKFDRIIEVE